MGINWYHPLFMLIPKSLNNVNDNNFECVILNNFKNFRFIPKIFK